MSNGLRFDIYERVHLPENVAAIDELEEVELVPRIQVIDQGENVLLTGQLVLNGIYRAQGTEDEQVALEHWIPVEITLPMNRVSQLDEITVDIDTFDVVLLSARALNLTGVLSLRGIAVELEEEQDSWDVDSFSASHVRNQQWGSDDSQVDQTQFQLRDEDHAHYQFEQEQQYIQEQEQADEQRQSYFEAKYVAQYDQSNQQASEERTEQEIDYTSYQFQATVNADQQEEEREQAEQSAFSEAAYNEAPPHYADVQQDRASEAEQVVETAHIQAQQQSDEDWSAWEQSSSESEQASDEQASDEQWVRSDDDVVQEQAAKLADEEPIEQPVEEEKEAGVQIALNRSNAQNETQGFRTILDSSLREQAAQLAAHQQKEEADRQVAEAEKNNTVDEDLEWKKLFLSRNNQSEFKKIRLIIVQKEETLEQLADRYQISPRDLLIRNNLHESAIAEGQLLYLP